jgi:hypothetical protein
MRDLILKKLFDEDTFYWHIRDSFGDNLSEKYHNIKKRRSKEEADKYLEDEKKYYSTMHDEDLLEEFINTYNRYIKSLI